MVTGNSMNDPAAKLPSVYGVKLIRGGRVAVHQLAHDSATESHPPGIVAIVYGVKPTGPNGELGGDFIDGQVVAESWRTLVVTDGRYTEISDYTKSAIDKFHIGLIRRIAIEGDGESRVWAIETLLELKV